MSQVCIIPKRKPQTRRHAWIPPTRIAIDSLNKELRAGSYTSLLAPMELRLEPNVESDPSRRYFSTHVDPPTPTFTFTISLLWIEDRLATQVLLVSPHCTLWQVCRALPYPRVI